jgi:hypothetical protein
MPKVKTFFSIVASGARELNGCDSSAEVEMQRAEGEGEIDGLAFVDRIAASANDWGSYFNSYGLPGSCIYPEQGSCD